MGEVVVLGVKRWVSEDAKQGEEERAGFIIWVVGRWLP
jgi:hypothetical protein